MRTISAPAGFSVATETTFHHNGSTAPLAKHGLQPISHFLWVYVVIFSTIMFSVIVAEHFFQ